MSLFPKMQHRMDLLLLFPSLHCFHWDFPLAHREKAAATDRRRNIPSSSHRPACQIHFVLWATINDKRPLSESQETTFEEITIAASLHFQHHFISQTQDEQLQQGEAEQELGGCIHHPALHPSISREPMGCLGVSHLILLQGCVKTAGKWKSWDIASKKLEIVFELCLAVLPLSLPSWNTCVLSCRKQEMFGGAGKLPCSESYKAVGVKGGGLKTGLGEPFCVWEGKVSVLLGAEHRMAPCLSPGAEGRGVRLRLLPSSRPTLVSSPGEEGMIHSLHNFHKTHFPELPPFWKWLFGRILGGLWSATFTILILLWEADSLKIHSWFLSQSLSGHQGRTVV